MSPSLPAPSPTIPARPTPSMADATTRAQRYAELPEDILLVGPTGSGKGYLADLIHRASGRRGAFVSVPGGELTDSLWASQLFGHYRGAFTGASADLKGHFELAAGGTLFLDEMHHWPPAVQSALLRPLESRQFAPLGAERPLTATCRILFATTTPPDELVAGGQLLPDLRYRLPALTVTVPALAERRDEILLLVEAHTARTLARFGWDPARFSWATSAVRALLLYPWPGNIRQLQRTVTQALADAGPAPGRPLEAADLRLPEAPAGDLAEFLEPEALGVIARWALRHGGGGRYAAADLLGVHRNTFRRYQRSAGGSFDVAPADAPLPAGQTSETARFCDVV